MLIWFGILGGFDVMRPVRPQEEKEVVVEQQQQEPKRAPKLRYLDFVHVAAAQAVVCLAGLYGLAKSHAGPLRPGVDAVESAVKGLVGPVYDRFHSVPLDVLAFVDRKVIIPPGRKSPLVLATPAVVRPAAGSRRSFAGKHGSVACTVHLGRFTPAAAETSAAGLVVHGSLDGSVPPSRYFSFPCAVHGCCGASSKRCGAHLSCDPNTRGPTRGGGCAVVTLSLCGVPAVVRGIRPCLECHRARSP